MKSDCHVVARRINGLIRELGVNFEIAWLSWESEEIRFADQISKDFDFGGCRISAVDFEGLVRGEFSADCFASDYSFRMRPFLFAVHLGSECGLRRLRAGLEQGLRLLPSAGGACAEADGQGQGGRGTGHLGGAGLASEHDGEGDQGLRGAQAGAQMDAGLRVPGVVQDEYFPRAVGL